MAESARRTARTRGVLIGASVALHLAVLLPLALSPPKPPSTPPEPRLFVVPVEISPARSLGRVRLQRAPSPLSRPAPRFSRPQRDLPTDTVVARPSIDPAAPVIADGWRVRPGATSGPPGLVPRPRGAACAAPQWLTPEEQAACDQRFAERAAAAPPINGTGDAGRDARFARQGARALAAYEERRETRASQRAECAKSGPVADCGVEIQVDIFSTVDGWFPNQQRED